MPDAALRSWLTKIQAEFVTKAYPDVPPNRCILRPQMIDELVRHRPATTSEFFGYIQPDLIRNTDPVQIDKSLGLVLMTIRMSKMGRVWKP